MNALPLMNHPLDEPTAFRPENLVAAVRQQRGAGTGSVPTLGILDFDGDLTDKLIARGEVQRCEHWPCFHTDMWLWPKDNPRCGIVARTIGGPYAVLTGLDHDAPYRETRSQIAHWASRGVLAVEMQAASLFAFGQTRGVTTGMVTHVTNAIDHDGEPFHKGPEDADVAMLAAIARITLS